MSTTQTPYAKFSLGAIVVTHGARTRLNDNDVASALVRHVSGDWGEIDQEDRRLNDDALAHGGRLLSAYVDRKRTRFFIITEADRSATTILLPEEY